MRLASVAVLMCAFVPGAASAQQRNLTFSGTVLVDSIRRPIENAAVAIPSLRKSTSTDQHGKFTIPDVRAGTHEVVVRMIGYAPYRERILFGNRQPSTSEILLTPVTT